MQSHREGMLFGAGQLEHLVELCEALFEHAFWAEVHLGHNDKQRDVESDRLNRSLSG